MRTASERRAAGEAPFCDCEHCACEAGELMGGTFDPEPIHLDRFAALLRALVVQTLLDPATWARPEGWRP